MASINVCLICQTYHVHFSVGSFKMSILYIVMNELHVLGANIEITTE